MKSTPEEFKQRVASRYSWWTVEGVVLVNTAAVQTEDQQVFPTTNGWLEASDGPFSCVEVTANGKDRGAAVLTAFSKHELFRRGRYATGRRPHCQA